MTNPSDTAAQGPMSRAEKLSLLSTMLGPDAMARLRDGQPDAPTEAGKSPSPVDAERAAWQRNRLLERLRHQGGGKVPDVAQTREGRSTPPLEKPVDQRALAAENKHLDARLAKISDIATLGHEHPAIIARLVKGLPRDERVEALKALPGPVARSIVRRLR
ncbi:hypothetical protein [Gymnodinialimonas sp.]